MRLTLPVAPPAPSFPLKLRPLRATASLLVAFLAIMVMDLVDGARFANDVDDRLRAMQVRQFLEGKGWYDLSLDGVSMPEPYISPWSRLVDAPYYLLAKGLQSFMTTDAALHFAFMVWPVVMMFAFAGVLGAVMVRLAPQARPLNPLFIGIAGLLLGASVLEFSPGRIDHHGVQLLCLVVIALGALLWSRQGGVIMAAAVTVSVTVGLECLPIIAALWSGLALTWVLRWPGSQAVFSSFSSTMAVLAPLVTLLVAGQDVLFSVENDIFSAPYVALFTALHFARRC